MKEIDQLMRRALHAGGAPGGAIAVVQGDRSYTGGYGVKTVGGSEPVGPETLFALASVSKAFTATACALLVDDAKMAWDDPVHKHLPAFRLLDPAADRQTTIRDLLCHRTGLPRHDSLWYGTAWSRAEILRRMAFLPPTANLREKYQYNNLCFLAAGEAAAAAAGEPFEAFLRRRLLEPLGMQKVNFSAAEIAAAADRATPHRKTRGKIAPIAFLDFTNVGPAGAMNASATDLLAWMRFQLAGGVAPDGTRLLSEAALRETHSPQMVTPLDEETRALFPDRIQEAYCLGWSLSNWKGQALLSHGGSIDGFRSTVALLPRAGIGVAVLANLAGYVPEMAACSALDLLLGTRERDWVETYAAKAKTDRKRERQTLRERAAKRLHGTRPSRPRSAYAGRYTHAGYGDASVSCAEDGRLHLSWGRFASPLQHWHADTFVTASEEPGFTQETIAFTLSPEGKVAGLSLFDQAFSRRETPENP